MRKLTLWMICLTMIAGSAHAESEHAPIKTHLMNTEERLATFQAQEKCAPEEHSTKTFEKSQYIGAKGLFGGCAFYHSSSTPYELHQAVTISYDSQFITLEEGSVFFVKPSDQWKVDYWPDYSQIYVVPNHGYFLGLIHSGYDLCLYNATTGHTIEVSLHAGPYLFGNNSEWVTNVDDYAGLVFLKNGRPVEVHPSDRHMIYSWEPNEHLIVGTNDGSGSYSYPNILVNVASVTYVRVRFL